jgi:hypothetical protein
MYVNRSLPLVDILSRPFNFYLNCLPKEEDS